MAIRAGLQLAIRVGCSLVQMETDSVEGAEACNGVTEDYSSLGFIAYDIRELITRFVESSKAYIPRVMV